MGQWRQPIKISNTENDRNLFIAPFWQKMTGLEREAPICFARLPDFNSFFHWGYAVFLNLRNGGSLAFEVEIPPLRILTETELEEAEWACILSDQLSFIEEKRITAQCHGHCHQRRIGRAYDKKVKPRSFQEGDLIPKKILPFREDPLMVNVCLTMKSLMLYQNFCRQSSTSIQYRRNLQHEL